MGDAQATGRDPVVLAHDARVPVYTLDPLETATNFNTTHYIPVMRDNLRTLVRALKQGG